MRAKAKQARSKTSPQGEPTYGYMLYDTEGVPYLATLATTSRDCWRRLKISKREALQVGWQCVRVMVQPAA